MLHFEVYSLSLWFLLEAWHSTFRFQQFEVGESKRASFLPLLTSEAGLLEDSFGLSVLCAQRSAASDSRFLPSELWFEIRASQPPVSFQRAVVWFLNLEISTSQ